MLLRGFKVIKLIVVALVVVFSASAEAVRVRPLGNPYGEPQVGFDDLPVPKSEADCQYTWARTLTALDGSQTHEQLCLRGMAAPHQNNYDRAIEDAAIAMQQGESIQAIMQAWPVEMRKPLHDNARALARIRGVIVNSEMAERDPKQKKSEYDKFSDRPHHMAVISSVRMGGVKKGGLQVEEHIEAQPGQEGIFKAYKP